MSEDDGVSTETLSELAKRRGFFFRSAEAYGGAAGFYTFGPEGAALKRNVEDAWRRRFTVEEGHEEIDAPTVMPEPVFEASGHLDGFDDMLVECAECGESHRADHLVEDATELEDAESIPISEVEELISDYDLRCPACGSPLAGQPVEEFNLMFETTIGPGSGAPGYLRPETAQGIFVEFPRLSEYARGQLPFGVTQVGRAYRNEISPRKAIIRVRELTQAELELFFDPEEDEPNLASVRDRTLRLYAEPEQNDDEGGVVETTVGEAVADGIVGNDWIGYYLGVASRWYESMGVDLDRFRFRQHLPGERAHYSVDCWDAEAEVDGDWIELAGFSYRGEYDLSKHGKHSEGRFTVFKQYDEPKTVERAIVDPDMSELGPAFGGAAADVAAELKALAGRDRNAFEGETVTVTVDDEEYEVPVADTGFTVEEVTETGEHRTPHVVEPSFGVDRLVYVLLDHAYREDVVDGEDRTYLELDPRVAPTFVGVFPLTDEDGLPDVAREVVTELRSAGLSVTYDDSGNIGRRYRRQDEVGTPFCVTVDHQSLDDDAVTVRDRDTTEQVRVSMDDLPETLSSLRSGDRTFDDLVPATASTDAGGE
jgi:glycyl-tRNA synthetase